MPSPTDEREGKAGFYALAFFLSIPASVVAVLAVLWFQGLVHRQAFVDAGVSFAVVPVATVLLVSVDILRRKIRRDRHVVSGEDYDAMPVNAKPGLMHINTLWKPVLVELAKDLSLLVLCTDAVGNALGEKGLVMQCLLLGTGLFVIQRCSKKNKRRLLLMLGLPTLGIGVLVAAWALRLERLWHLGAACLWGTVLETTSKMVSLLNPAWCAHYTDANSQTLQEAVAKCRTGDILLVSGYERTSWTLRFFSNGDWSHVAMLLRSPPPAVIDKLAAPWDRDSECPVWVLECDPEYIDERRGDSGGSQIAPADVYLSNLRDYYEDRHVVVIRHLILPSDESRNQFFQSPQAPDSPEVTWGRNFPALERFLLTIADIPYESSQWDLVRSAFKLNSTQSNINELFCSELIAEAYLSMGLVSRDVSSHNYTPRDFCSRSPWHLNLQRGAGLTRERRIRERDVEVEEDSEHAAKWRRLESSPNAMD